MNSSLSTVVFSSISTRSIAMVGTCSSMAGKLNQTRSNVTHSSVNLTLLSAVQPEAQARQAKADRLVQLLE